MPSAKIEVHGIKELQASLKRIDTDLPREMKAGFLRVSVRLASTTAGKVPHGATGGAAASVHGVATQRGGAIAVGGRAAPYFPWLDFGGSTGRGHLPGVGGSGSIKRPIVKEGRYEFPTIREHSDDIRREVEDFMDKLTRRAGF